MIARGPAMLAALATRLEVAWRARLASVVQAAWFGHLSTALVLYNMALMCMPYHGMSESYAAE